MAMNFSYMKQQAQEFVLRLFIESTGSGSSSSSTQYYTCAHVGTHARLHQ